MSNRLNLLLTRLPSYFAKDKDSNNYKLLSLIAKGSDETRAVYDTMLKFWDVDQSEGIGLDRLGKDEGILRGSWDDEEYRKMIKIQCILNLSEGDIDTMNQIMDAYMGKDFIGFEEGWSVINEPASLLANVTSSISRLPTNLIKHIKPAGVKFYWIVNAFISELKLFFKCYQFPVTYAICNTFQTDTLPGKLARGTFALHQQSYLFDAYTPICGTFVTSTINSVQSNLNVELSNHYRDIDVLYKRASQQTLAGEGEI